MVMIEDFICCHVLHFLILIPFDNCFILFYFIIFLALDAITIHLFLIVLQSPIRSSSFFSFFLSSLPSLLSLLPSFLPFFIITYPPSYIFPATCVSPFQSHNLLNSLNHKSHNSIHINTFHHSTFIPPFTTNLDL